MKYTAFCVGVVIKKSSYEMYVEEKKNHVVRALLKKDDALVMRIKQTHEIHHRTILELFEVLKKNRIEVKFVCNTGDVFNSNNVNAIITVGGDGTLLSASHHVADVPLLGINSAPKSSVGFFCGARNGKIAMAIQRLRTGTLQCVLLSRMQVQINGNIVAKRVLNEALFCHMSPAATSRYVLKIDATEEEQKSSGFWIGPAAGSTAAQRSAGGRILPISSKKLQLVVRELYTPLGEKHRFKRALISENQSVVVRSKMDDARIFVDGPNEVFSIGFGDVVEFSRAPEPLKVLGMHIARHWKASFGK